MSILIVSGIEGIRNCADVVAKQLGMTVDVAESRRAAVSTLRRKEFAAVVVDVSVAECDPASADAIWERSGLAIPLEINFALSSSARIVREIRAALQRRQREQAAAQKAATAAIEVEVRNTVAGLLLHSELALSQEGVPNAVAEKLRVVADLAATLRTMLSAEEPQHREGSPTLP